MLRHRVPEIGKALDEIVIVRQSRLEIGIGMHVDFDRQARVKNHLHRGVKIAKIFIAAACPPRGIHHRLRIHAEPHMVEAGGFDQCDVGRRAPGLKMFLRISSRIVNLREPLAQIDAMTQVCQARGGNRRERRSLSQ